MFLFFCRIAMKLPVHVFHLLPPIAVVLVRHLEAVHQMIQGQITMLNLNVHDYEIQTAILWYLL